jgi:serine/threonine-protein kinase
MNSIAVHPELSSVSSQEIQAYLKKILGSGIFSRAERMRRFLEFIVEEALAGRTENLREYVIGVSVYQKPESLDPRFDPLVRVEAARLRSKLKEYYETEGAEDPVIIRLPKRSYAPSFEWRTADSTPRAGDPDPHEFSIAVLPFSDLSRNRDQEGFCDELTEEVINALAQVEELRVVARTSVLPFKGKGQDIREIGRELNVAAVLEGSVRTSLEKLRITAQLNSAATGYHLWSETFDMIESDPFELQRELSRLITDKVVNSVGRQHQRQ